MPKRNTNNQKKRKPGNARQQQEEATTAGKLIRAIGGLGGSALGNLIGQAGPGAAIGTSLGAAISKWLGAGDYEVSSNSIVTRTQRGSAAIPMMHKEGQSVVVRHKEYIGEVRGSTGFTTQFALPLNPGMSQTFPWLSTIASRFQEYDFKGVVFHYVPTSGDAVSSTNPALGSVMMQTTYRATDTTPSSKIEMLNEYWSAESVPSDTFVHPIECDPSENIYRTQYVRTGAIPATDTLAMYDLGTTFLSVAGQQTTNNPVGDLWVTYEVVLKKPVLASAVNSPIQSATYSFLTPTSTSLFNASNTPILNGNIPLTASVNTLTFPKGVAGVYQITAVIACPSGFASGSAWSSPTTFNNCSLLATDNYNSSSPYSAAVATSAFYMMISFRIVISDPAVVPSIVFASPTLGASVTSSINVVVAELSSNSG